MPALDDVYARVTRVLVEALGAGEGDIEPSATPQGDLGAKSADSLDITFRVERDFRITIPRGDVFPGPISSGDPARMRDGRVTNELRVLEHGVRLNRIDDLLTAGLLVSYIRWQPDGAVTLTAISGLRHVSPGAWSLNERG